MKRIFTILLVLGLVFGLMSAVSLAAETVESGKCGENLTWTFDSNGTLTISGTGAMDDYYLANEPWGDEYPSPWHHWFGDQEIKKVVIEEGVTSIGSYAFYGRGLMGSVSLPESLTRIGRNAFEYCARLKSVRIPAAVTYLGGLVFHGCEELTDITVAPGNKMFCSDDRGVVFDKDRLVLLLAPNGISGSYTVPDSVLEITDYAFYGCRNLNHVELNDDLTYIGLCSFMECGLKEVRVPENVNYIGSCAFDGTNVRAITIPYSVTYMGQDIFWGDALQEVFYCGDTARREYMTLDQRNEVLLGARWHYECQLRQQGDETVIYCPECDDLYNLNGTLDGIMDSGTCGENLTWQIEDNGVLTISGTGAMDDYSSYNPAPWQVWSPYILEAVVEPGVTTIGSNGFAGCSEMKHISLPETLTGIGEYAFTDCKALSEINLPQSLRVLGDYAFESCDALVAVFLPEGLTTIGYTPFFLCSYLTNMVIPADVTVDDSSISSGYSLTNLFFMGPKAQAEPFLNEETGYDFKWVNIHWDVRWTQQNGQQMLYCPQCDCCYDPWENYRTDDLTWELEDGVLTISGEGPMRDYNYVYAAPWYAYQQEIREVVIESGVTRIGDFAFYHCQSIEKITIADTVTDIGGWAFYECSLLQAVAIPEGVTCIDRDTFNYCYELASVTLPSSLEEIRDRAFDFCYSLEALTIPGGVRIIGENAFSEYLRSVKILPGMTAIVDRMFYDCAGLTDISIPETVTTIGDYAFYGCRSLPGISIPEGVTRIGEGAFYYCDNLVTVTIPASVKNIEKEAFYSCGNLKDITIPEGITQIKEGTFAWCSSLGDLTLPSTLTEIAADGFIGCRSFQSIDLPHGLTLLGDNAFSDCSELKHITLPETLCTVGEYVFSYCESLERITIPSSLSEIGWGMFHDCTKLKDVAMGNSVVKIGPFAFEDCDSLQSITIPSSVTEIGHYAFAGCSGLKHVVIPQGVTVIDWGTFEECISLERVTIPAGVTVIGRYAFQYCYELTDVHFTGTEEQKAAIAIDTYNDKLADIPWHCSVAVEQQSGQTVYFCSQCDQHYLPDGSEPTEKAEISLIGQGFTLSFEDEILVNFYYTAENIDDVTEQGMLVFYNDPGAADIAKADDVYIGSVLSNGAFANTTKGIAAKKMGDEQYYCAYAKGADGTYAYSPLYSYSPEKYAMGRIQNSSNEELKALCVAMLNYGAAAQEFFGYRTDDLMNAGLTAEQQALVAEYDAALFAGAIPADASKTVNFAQTATGFAGCSASVSFEGAFAINYYFTPSETVAGDMKLYVWNAEAYEAAEVLTADNATVMTMEITGDKYFAPISGIAPKKLDKTIYVAGVYEDANGNTYCTGVIAYSLSRYCMNNAKPGKPMQTLAAATAMYGYYANNYFA